MTVSPDPLPAYMEKSFFGQPASAGSDPHHGRNRIGSDKFTIITDTEKQVKMLLKGEMLLPDLAVIDPAFTLTAPPSVTAATEWTPWPTQWSLILPESIILSPICMPCQRSAGFSAVCPRAFQNGQDKKAREEMALAAYEAGICINNASVTIVHGMSRPIGALFHVPHGISNAMLMQTCFFPM